jgi:hypothetical protein
MATLKLNQAIAIEKSVKARVYAETTEIYKALQKPDLVNGLMRTYQKAGDDGMDLPPETKQVQVIAERALRRIGDICSEAWDVEATKDLGNTKAFADVVVDGEVLIANAPATLLLHLEKQLNDMRSIVEKLVVLSDDREWTYDEKNGLWKSEPARTHRTEKVQKGITLAQATDKHPAQTQLITQDVIVGYWSTVNWSGALPTTRRRDLLDRIDKLQRAVKTAREEANLVEVDKQYVGKKLFDYILK